MVLWLILLWITAAVPHARAQTPAGGTGPAIIHADVSEVIVEVAVTGKKGSQRRGLTAKDFSIWEDGKKQIIRSCSAGADTPESLEKHIVLYIPDTTATETRRAILQFVDGVASPDRHMAVVGSGRSGAHVIRQFTTSSADLGAAINRPALSVEALMAGSGPQGSLAVSLSEVARSIAPAPGRKALIVFGAVPAFPSSYTLSRSDGSFQVIRTGADQSSFVATCNRANVAVYVVPNFFADASASELARETGGAVIDGRNNLADSLAAIVREQDDSYRLSYTPPASRDGVCHSLRVAVDTAGADVRARKEYCTQKPLDLVAGKVEGESVEARAAAGRGSMSSTLQLPFFYTSTNRADVRVAADLLPAGMKFQEHHGKLQGQLDVVGIASRPDGAVAARFSDSVDISLDSRQQADEFVRTPYHYENQFTVPSGHFVFRLAFGAGGSAFGRVEAQLQVAPWDSDKFGIGGIAFTTDVQPAGNEGSGSAVLLLEGREPLAAGGMRITPAGTDQFQRSSRVYFYTEVYEPSLSGANPAQLSMRPRVYDRRSGEVKYDSGAAGIARYVRQGNSVVTVVTRVPVSDLPAGAYRLEVSAMHSSGPEVVSRSADFELK